MKKVLILWGAILMTLCIGMITPLSVFATPIHQDQTTETYNSQLSLGGGLGSDPDGLSNWVSFLVDTTDLDPEYVAHFFDWYNTNVHLSLDDIDVDDFALFSRDAHHRRHQSAPVPEPATMLLFGTGLLGIAMVGKKRKKPTK